MADQSSAHLTQRRTFIGGLVAGAASLLLGGDRHISPAASDAQLFIRATPRLENVEGRPHVIVGGHAEVRGHGRIPHLTVGIWRSATARDQTLSLVSAPSHVVLSPGRLAVVLGSMKSGREIDFEVGYPLGQPTQSAAVGQFTFIAGTQERGFHAPLLAARSYPTWMESPPREIRIDDPSVPGL